MNPTRIEQLGGDELPKKAKRRINNVSRISPKEFYMLDKEFIEEGWGSVVNNPCEVYRTSDGKIIEVYGARQFGFATSIFIGSKDSK